MFVCATDEISPLVPNSSEQNERETKPRSSRCGSMSTIITPATSVGVYFTSALLPQRALIAVPPDVVVVLEKRWGNQATQVALGIGDQYSHCDVPPSSRSRPLLVDRITVVGIQYGLLHREGLGVAGAALHPTDSHQAKKNLVVKPAAAGLRWIALGEQSRLVLCRFGWDRE